jgi:uncharacterized protein YjbI with pentapeptide repeats
MKLKGANLTNANLTGATLTGVDLTNLATVWEYPSTTLINIVNTTLSGANLTGVTSGGIVGSPPLPSGWRLVNGHLVGKAAVLRNADLSGANLSGLDLTGADFTNAQLTNANFTNSTVINVILTSATVTGTIFATDSDNKLAGMVSGDLKGVPKTLSATGRFRIVEGYFVGPSANLSRAVFSPQAQLGVSLSGTNFTDATLEGISFVGATMVNANLTRANLRGTLLEGADLSAATLTGVLSGGTRGQFLKPPGWKLVDGYLVGPGANLRNAELYGADLTGANLTSADLTGADIANATLTSVVWSNTTCPNGGRQSSPCTPLAGPRATVAATTKGDGALYVDVGPDIAAGVGWTFTVQERLTTGEWRAVDTYETSGPGETKAINLRNGTYRVQVDRQLGYFGIKSSPVVLAR